MENHANRPEVAAALRGEQGISLRHSATVGYDMLYVARPVRLDGRIVGVARAALPLAAVDRTAGTLVWAIGLASGVAAVAAFALTVWIGLRLTKPIQRLTMLAGTMAAGRLDSRFDVTSRDEIGELGRTFNRMADRLQETFETISAERNRLAAILETVADGVLIVDPGGRVMALNPAAERLLQTGSRRAVGEPFMAVARDHELAGLLERPDRTGRLIELGHPRRQVRALAATIPGTGGQRLLLLQDLTELRRLESVRRDFVANVSHELRTPIAAIKAIVETLEDGALDDPPAARTFLSSLNDEVDRLTQMVRELLELSRIESGQAEVAPRPTVAVTLLTAAVERMRPLAERAGLELRLVIPPDLPPVQADAERIDQVLANLIHNGVKFTPPGGWVEVRACEGEGFVAISVADSGVGVPPDDLDRIFERFFKTDRSRSGGGTGLGLAIAKHLVQAHGGRIWAESVGSHGTTFTFTLPIVRESPAILPVPRGTGGAEQGE
jgi:two-component system phosphate regulon sensor histidine kinase PhoR